MIENILEQNDINLPDHVLQNYNWVAIDRWGWVKGYISKPEADPDHQQWEGVDAGDKLSLRTVRWDWDSCDWRDLIVRSSYLMTAKPVVKKDSKQVGGDHYKRLKIGPLDYAEANELGLHEFNVVKYVSRHEFKGGRADLDKAIHYLERLKTLRYPEEGL